MNKPREYLHTKECLAAAMISAIENLRDMEGETDFGFRYIVQNNAPLHLADDYLANGTVSCRCPNGD